MAAPRGYRWNPTLKRYIAPNGRIVSAAQVRSALDDALRAMDGKARDLAAQLRSGAISLASFEREMRTLIKDVQLYGAAAAAGGWAQLDQSALGRVGSLTRIQYDYLHGFVQDVATGTQRLDGTLTVRASLYAQQGRRTFYKQMAVEMEEIGHDEERSIRHASDSCDGCIDAADQGWQPIGTLPEIGERDCLSRCKCTKEYRSSTTGDRANPRPPRARV